MSVISLCNSSAYINTDKLTYADQKYSGIANAKVLKEQRTKSRIHKLNFLHLFTDLFRKDFSPLMRINRSFFQLTQENLTKQ